MPITHAQSGMEIISRQECLRLLATQRVGRLGFIVGDQPMVLPINFAVQGDVVVFRTGEGSKLEAALLAKVALEVDDVDFVAGTAWSVVVQGVAEEITNADDWVAEELRRDAAPTWAPGLTEHYVRINPSLISGRRLPLPEAPVGGLSTPSS
jgi:nitroimidazol reductase NimA-like FMN-containing flavoprotein (pyridoxamine 5'-phosphate oxidase superfamily)